MADAWTTVVTREPEYDADSRARVLALMAWESNRCPKCHNYDSIEPVPTAEQGVVTWPNGRAFRIHQYRCQACGALEIFQRHWTAEHEKDKPFPGQAMPIDGLMTVVRPATEVV